MHRRSFITAFGLVFWTGAPRAQLSAPVRKLGLIMPSRAGDPYGQQLHQTLTAALGQLGWVEGVNISLMTRWSGGEPELAQQYAKELVSAEPDLILAGSTIGLDAARLATSTIPIVFVGVSDPVAAGFIDSLAKPNGNITGFTSFDVETGGKWLEILRSIIPATRRIGVLMDPDYPGYVTRWAGISNLGTTLRVELSQVAIRAGADLEKAVSEFAKEPNRGLVVLSSALTSANSRLIIELVQKYRLPTIYPFSFFVRQGGLISYGLNSRDLYSRSAGYVDRILKGAKPADLPVQRPTKYEMFVNLSTARALGLTIPDKLLQMADEVIE